MQNRYILVQGYRLCYLHSQQETEYYNNYFHLYFWYDRVGLIWLFKFGSDKIITISIDIVFKLSVNCEDWSVFYEFFILLRLIVVLFLHPIEIIFNIPLGYVKVYDLAMYILFHKFVFFRYLTCIMMSFEFINLNCDLLIQVKALYIILFYLHWKV